jgi:hypothetical protein
MKVMFALLWRVVEPSIRSAYAMGRADQREADAALVESLDPYESNGYYAGCIRAGADVDA